MKKSKEENEIEVQTLIENLVDMRLEERGRLHRQEKKENSIRFASKFRGFIDLMLWIGVCVFGITGFIFAITSFIVIASHLGLTYSTLSPTLFIFKVFCLWAIVTFSLMGIYFLIRVRNYVMFGQKEKKEENNN